MSAKTSKRNQDAPTSNEPRPYDHRGDLLVERAMVVLGLTIFGFIPALLIVADRDQYSSMGPEWFRGLWVFLRAITGPVMSFVVYFLWTCGLLLLAGVVFIQVRACAIIWRWLGGPLPQPLPRLFMCN